MLKRNTALSIAGTGILAIPILLFGWSTFQRPAQTDLAKPLFQGVTYQRQFRRSPRPIMLHTVTVNLKAPGVRVIVTPGEPQSTGFKVNARTTSKFLQEFKVQLAVNASFFYPFKEATPWDYYPQSGNRVSPVGQAIANGIEYAAPLPNWSVLCISSDQRAQILSASNCAQGTAQAVAGSSLIVKNGQSMAVQPKAADSDGNYSRTAVAVDKSGTKMWILAIDDKQWLYSEGVSLAELADIAIALGAETALNLDGGGSTTLVTEAPNGFQVLNAPVHTKIPMRERPVANHLGFYALPLSDANN